MKLDVVYDDQSVVTLAPVPSRPPLWMHLEDKDIPDSSWGGGIRPCASCPAVWVLKDDPHVEFGEQWQYYLRAINPGMTLENVYLLLDDHLAFANNTGFPKFENPGGLADYFFRRNIGAKPPRLDKVRTCSRSVLTGDVVGDKLQVSLFDSRKPPPLKPGRGYPTRIEDVNADDYLYIPRTHPWMFLTATIVNKAGGCVQFPRGAVYSWTGDSTARSFMPHVYNPTYGEVLYPLSKLRKIGDREPVPSPYRSVAP